MGIFFQSITFNLAETKVTFTNENLVATSFKRFHLADSSARAIAI